MSAFAEDKDRRLVPRWRFADQLSFSQEFAGDPRFRRRAVFDRRHLEEKLADWNHTPRIGTAIDLVSCGVGGRWLEEVRPAAEYLTKHRPILTPQTITLVGRALAPTESTQPNADHRSVNFTLDTFNLARDKVAGARRKIERDPRSALAWLDLARGQATLGHKKKATLAAKRALYLTPYHRHTLRAATRFFIHIGEYDRAHSLLVRNSRTATDPWLMAAEISASQIAECQPRFAKSARRLIEAQQLPPEHLTELQSALGTLEYYSGAARHARKYLHASLEAPNDNTVAQARWLRTKLPGIDIHDEAFALPLSFEARCWDALEKSSWRQARIECLNWLYDEPFSSRPTRLGSYIGTSLTSDHAFAEAIAQTGLRADPNDATLLNNLTVALAYQGKTEKAIERFSKIKPPLPNDFPSYVYLATTGLLHFRIGSIAAGRELYSKAERRAPLDKKGEVGIFRAREELFAQTAIAHEQVERARKMNKNAKSAYSKRLLELLDQQARRKRVHYVQDTCASELMRMQCQLAPIVNTSDLLPVGLPDSRR